MRTSGDRILTTHTGSLPRPPDLVEALNAKELGRNYDEDALNRTVTRAVHDIVRRQADIGLDVINDGEHSKVSWMAYARGRLAGLKEIDSPVRFRGATRDSLAFPAAYEDMKTMLAGRSSALVAKRTVRPKAWICSGPMKYVGERELQTDFANLKAALSGVDAVEDVFMTAISPSNLELYYENNYYPSSEEYLAALADAMRVEYKAIVDAGLVAADRRPADGDPLQPVARRLDRGLPEIHRAAGRGGQLRAARHPGGSGSFPHLLQRQHRASRIRLRAQALRRSHAQDSRGRLRDRGRQPAPRA